MSVRKSARRVAAAGALVSFGVFGAVTPEAHGSSDRQPAVTARSESVRDDVSPLLSSLGAKTVELATQHQAKCDKTGYLLAKGVVGVLCVGPDGINGSTAGEVTAIMREDGSKPMPSTTFFLQIDSWNKHGNTNFNNTMTLAGPTGKEYNDLAAYGIFQNFGHPSASSWMASEVDSRQRAPLEVRSTEFDLDTTDTVSPEALQWIPPVAAGDIAKLITAQATQAYDETVSNIIGAK